MKKVLVAGAALLIAGSMVSAAYAEVALSGDARVRYVGRDGDRSFSLNPNGTIEESQQNYVDHFNSRVRVKFDAKSNGGAFMKARVRFDDIKWDNQGWGAASEDKNVWADYAYIGVPMGTVTFSGGRMPADYSKWFSYDQRPTRVKFDWKSGAGLRLIGLIDVIDEFANSVDDWNDDDFMGYGLVAQFKINDDWSVKGYARYHDDQRAMSATTVTVPVSVSDTVASQEFDNLPSVSIEELNPNKDKSGFLGSIDAKGSIGPLGLEGGIAYKEADVIGSSDDGIGWYVDGSMDFDALRAALVVGGTYDGYQADDDFGFIMIGAAEPITVIETIGFKNTDTLFAGLVTNFQVSDQFKLAGNLVYYDIDVNATEKVSDIRRVADAWEISGSATYVISEGADLTYKLGYLDVDYDGERNAAGLSNDGYFGHYLRMAIKF